MRTLHAISELRDALLPARRDGKTIGLVPTMGAFHAGHLSLMRQARGDCDVVVVSLFVNPTQFEDQQDLAAYPRDEQRDAALAEEAGVDFLFAPPVAEMYPPGFATTISVSGFTEVLEGMQRGSEHFDAVTTIVAKLLNIVGPQVAYFGQKDAQQALVIERMVRDLNMPVRFERCPTIREPDGLAMSSRNVRLRGPSRTAATALYRALTAVQQAVAAGEGNAAGARARGLTILREQGVEPDYLELVDPDTLAPLAELDHRPILALIAGRIGSTRLIDNQLIQPHENGRT